MRLEEVVLKNFRSYSGEHRVPVKDLTVFIGKNDAGKSTVLEVLEIFFNSDQVKFDASDYCIDDREGEVRIGCVFSDAPEELVLDAQAKTNLRDEYLLNENGLLEIHKVYSNGSTKVKTYLMANYPVVEEFGGDPLILLTNAKLKALVKKILGEKPEGVSQASNPSMRIGLLKTLENPEKRLVEIVVDKGEGKPIWETLSRYLPMYNLFRSDKKNDDKDGEIQDPIKFAVKSAIDTIEIKEELDKIKKDVLKAVKDVADRTISKLREMDEDIADALNPELLEEPKWDQVFKYKIEDGEGVPLNKRGSGVRRLVLLNFFRAEADRKLLKDGNRNDIIFAIEEPETSQHPDNQQLLAEALKELSISEGTQVLLTTHVPAMAELLPVESFYLVHKKNENEKRIESPENGEYDGLLSTVASTLGITPNPNEVKVILSVEGPNDVSCVEKFSKILCAKANDKYVDLTSETTRAVVLPMGGGNLKHWVRKRYLSKFDRPEIGIFDKDQDKKYSKQVEAIKNRDDMSWATLTEGLTFENYLHPEVVSKALGIDVDFSMEDDVSLLVAKKLNEKNNGKPWAELKDDKRKKKIKRAKAKLNDEVASKMTYDQLIERDEGGILRQVFSKVSELAMPN